MKKWSIVPILVLGMVSLAAAAEPKKNAVQPALLVIDVQNAYLPYMDAQEREQALAAINGYISMFRLYKLPVIRIYHTDPQGGPPPGSEPFEFAKSVLIQDGDAKVVKNYGNAFKKTDLDRLLRERGINTLFLCGLSATACVLATYHGAVDLDYDTFLLKGALLSGHAELTRAVQDICQTVDYGPLKLILELCKP